MAGTAPRLAEQFRNVDTPNYVDETFNVSELASDAAGAHSPFGDTELPMPLEQIMYVHPTPADRPHLADGR